MNFPKTRLQAFLRFREVPLPPLLNLAPHSPELEAFEPLLPMLVTGVAGVPGYNAFLYFRRLFPGQVDGLVPEHSELPAGPPSLPLPPSGLVRFDAENVSVLEAWFDARKYRSVIDASGWCALKAAELDPRLARRLNIDIGLNIAGAASRHGCKLIRLSSDLVFSGDPRPVAGHAEPVLGGYREEETPDPVTVYGKCMAEAENLIRAAKPETWILRVSLPMGPSANDHAGAVDWIDSRFRRRLPATLYYDEVRTPIYVQDLNRVLATLLLRDASGQPEGGILHVGGPRRLSLNQIAQAVNVAGGYDPHLLMGCMRHAAGPMPPRAGDVSMVFDKLESLLGRDRIRPWPASPAFAPTHRHWHGERSPDFLTRLAPRAIERHLYGLGWPMPTAASGGEEEGRVASAGAVSDAPPWDHPLLLLEAWRQARLENT